MGAGFAINAKGKKAAEILIYEDVGEGWFGGVGAKQFADELKSLGDIDTIDVRINSYGGDVFTGEAIYNRLVEHKATVRTHIDGVAASIASVIAMAGDEIHIAENGWIMIHDAWTMAAGNADDLRRQATLLDGVTKGIAGVYTARTGKPEDEIRALMREETWLSAEDAVAMKFATRIVENKRVAAFAPPAGRFRNSPQVAAPRTIKISAEEQTLRDRVAAQMQRLRMNRSLSNITARAAA